MTRSALPPPAWLPDHDAAPGDGDDAAIDLHVFAAGDLAPDREALAGSLTPRETGRAAALRRAVDRERFVLFRGALRRVLGLHAGLPPEDLVLVCSPLGKPALDPPDGRAPLAFSLSHCDDLLVVAVGRGMTLGVDIERVRCRNGLQRLARRILGPREAAAFASLAPQAQTAAFWRAWTCKEAYLKGTGDGLSFPLPSVEVTLTPDCPPRLCAVAGRPRDTAIWNLHDFRPAPGIAGALATTRAAARLRLHGVRNA